MEGNESQTDIAPCPSSCNEARNDAGHTARCLKHCRNHCSDFYQVETNDQWSLVETSAIT